MVIPFAKITVAIPAQAIIQSAFHMKDRDRSSPCSSKVHLAQLCGRDFQLNTALWATVAVFTSFS
jgi:hypothetical protein